MSFQSTFEKEDQNNVAFKAEPTRSDGNNGMKSKDLFLIVMLGIVSLILECIWGCCPDYSFHDVDSQKPQYEIEPITDAYWLQESNKDLEELKQIEKSKHE